MTDAHPPDASRREWTVSRCAHGCFFVDLDQVTLKLSPEQLSDLLTLLGDAFVRWGVEEVTDLIASAHPSAH